MRHLRQAKGLTQLDVANHLGVTPGTVYNWERGKGEPRGTQLQELARLFGVSADDVELRLDAGAKGEGEG